MPLYATIAVCGLAGLLFLILAVRQLRPARQYARGCIATRYPSK